MRRALTSLVLASSLFAALPAFAKDDVAPPPPPPPPPPSSETTTSSSSGESDAPSGSTFKQTDALLDRTTGKKRPMQLSFFLGLPYGYYYFGGFGFSLAARFNIPIIHDGFVPQINDSFDLEFGIDATIVPGATYYARGPVYFMPIVEPRYTVYLLPKLAVYAKPLNLGVVIWPGPVGSQVVFFHYSAALGVIYKLTDAIALRAELGSYVLRAGIGINF